ncbi:universal stress protein [Salinirubellus salinus]|jgi:nucleotide-binding universal stress UspA family protein|uniref:Universal stress protein n=1 Tax=Salinirubellus salinus TaxID=1364945 RepID=A0A9E7UD05_9EURY|nr:universal stress protein [Salinirubellus salinus]UWM56867.1 universal stress protein [Salinirubellus salinus]
MYDDILVPTDGSDHARRAAEHAGVLARQFDATVHLLAVLDVQAAAGPFSAGGIDEQFVERLERTGDVWLNTAAQAVGDVTVHRDNERGEPAKVILSYAEAHDADLVVMGTHGRKGVRRYVSGSVTERVVQRAAVPVLATHGADPILEEAYGDVLVATDGSEAAEAAVEHGIDLATRTGARVHAVSLVDLGRLGTGAEDAPVLEWRNFLEAEAERATEAVVERAEAAGVEAVAAVREDSPVPGLLAYADEAGVDLLVVGTHGRRGVTDAVLGSTAERILRRAERPVLTVRKTDAFVGGVD